MQITKQVHAIKIPFKVPISPDRSIDRYAFAYLFFGQNIHLIDSGVAGSEDIIFEYLKAQGREPREISSLILTHSHPDHIGAARTIKSATNCRVYAHKLERNWIEDTEQQFRDRPVPGFHNLVDGSIEIDILLDGGEIIELEKGTLCKTIHTPGHSKGSISLLLEEDTSLFTADALIYPGDLPIYEDISGCIRSINVLREISTVENLFSSWEHPIQGRHNIIKRMDESIAYLQRIHTAVNNNIVDRKDMMALCQKVVQELGLPPFAAMPLVAKAFASSIAAE
jgi:glyoxylase-like metal-dependent hydrolase (beta-lactamase superfamily II)